MFATDLFFVLSGFGFLFLLGTTRAQVDNRCGYSIAQGICAVDEVKEDCSQINEEIAGLNTFDADICLNRFLVSIQEDRIGKADCYFHVCGATLIAPNLIITAAHCVYSKIQDQAELQGTSFSTPLYAALAPSCRHYKGYDRIDISEYWIHEDYNDFTLQNDIAILRLNSTVTSIIRQEEFAKYDNTLVRDQIESSNLDIVGWGATDVEEQSQSTYTVIALKAAANQQLMNQAQCVEGLASVNDRNRILPGMLCAQGNGSDTCFGDSGGPLLYFLNGGSPFLIGIVSWGAEKSQCATNETVTVPGVYTNVSFYFDWIDSIVQENKVTPSPRSIDALNVSQGTYSFDPLRRAPEPVQDTLPSPLPSPMNVPSPTVSPSTSYDGAPDQSGDQYDIDEDDQNNYVYTICIELIKLQTDCDCVNAWEWIRHFSSLADVEDDRECIKLSTSDVWCKATLEECTQLNFESTLKFYFIVDEFYKGLEAVCSDSCQQDSTQVSRCSQSHNGCECISECMYEDSKKVYCEVDPATCLGDDPYQYDGYFMEVYAERYRGQVYYYDYLTGCESYCLESLDNVETTIGGCRCITPCQNTDDDPNGNWCLVDQLSCERQEFPSWQYNILGQVWDYCAQQYRGESVGADCNDGCLCEPLFNGRGYVEQNFCEKFFRRGPSECQVVNPDECGYNRISDCSYNC